MLKSSREHVNFLRIILADFRSKIIGLFSIHKREGVEIRLNLGRMENLITHIEEFKVNSILEVGVWKGENALNMLRAAFKLSNNVTYVGVDLFEELASLANLEKEASLWPETQESVYKKLTEEFFELRIELYAGYSKDILPTLIGRKFELILIDGGHSYETVLGDWTEALKLISDGGYIFIDDYTNIEATIYANFGVKKLVDSLDVETFHVQILEPEDSYEWPWGELRTRMVKIGSKTNWK